MQHFLIMQQSGKTHPVCRSPIINSLWPLPIGTRESMAFSPVCMGSLTLTRAMIPGALISTLLRCLVSIGPCKKITKYNHIKFKTGGKETTLF